jgi:hypothetical protein
MAVRGSEAVIWAFYSQVCGRDGNAVICRSAVEFRSRMVTVASTETGDPHRQGAYIVVAGGNGAIPEDACEFQTRGDPLQPPLSTWSDSALRRKILSYGRYRVTPPTNRSTMLRSM